METPLPPAVPEPAARKANGLATTAGALGIGAVVIIVVAVIGIFISPAGFALVGTVCAGLSILIGIVALVLGIIGLVQIKNHPGQTGKGMAITSVVIGALSVVLLCLSPVLVTTTLMLLGPVIGNVFTEINSSLTAP